MMMKIEDQRDKWTATRRYLRHLTAVLSALMAIAAATGCSDSDSKTDDASTNDGKADTQNSDTQSSDTQSGQQADTPGDVQAAAGDNCDQIRTCASACGLSQTCAQACLDEGCASGQTAANALFACTTSSCAADCIGGANTTSCLDCVTTNCNALSEACSEHRC